MKIRKRFVVIPPETHHKLRIMAANRDCSLATLTKDLVEQAFQQFANFQQEKGTMKDGEEKTNVQTKRR